MLVHCYYKLLLSGCNLHGDASHVFIDTLNCQESPGVLEKFVLSGA